MLIEFKVKNFKNFKEELYLDFSKIKKYRFNFEAIKQNNIKTSLIYGKNGSGKSNLGLAIFDISNHLTDKVKELSSYKHFLNLETKNNAIFYYKFRFDSKDLIYKYVKEDLRTIVNEELYINNERVIYYNHKSHEGDVKLEGAEALKKDLGGLNISFVKYVIKNAVLVNNEINIILKKFISFVDNMLLFKSFDKVCYQETKIVEKTIVKKMTESRHFKELKLFLKKLELEYELFQKQIDGKRLIFCRINGREVNFFSIASRGELLLVLSYCWLKDLNNASLVFIDGFDGFYHNEVARKIIKEVRQRKTQAIITTHNTTLMNNDILRPDCYFNLSNGRIQSLSNSTLKELRKAHNLERMYKSNAFNDKEANCISR